MIFKLLLLALPIVLTSCINTSDIISEEMKSDLNIGNVKRLTPTPSPTFTLKPGETATPTPNPTSTPGGGVGTPTPTPTFTPGTPTPTPTSVIPSDCADLRADWGLNDTYLCVQWHLNNTGQSIPKLPGSGNFSSTGTPGMDIRATTTLKTYQGNNVNVYVSDNGAWKHNDIVSNLSGYDNVTGQNDGQGIPYRGTFNCGQQLQDEGTHGTMVSGIIAAVGNNGIGVVGIAHKAKVFSNNFVSMKAQCGGFISPAEAIEALNPTGNYQVWSGSFGSSGCGGHSSRPDYFDAYSSGIAKNISYQKANGNGWRPSNQGGCREDGNAEPVGSHQGILHIAALDNKGVATDYSTRGANLSLSCFAGYGGNSSSPGIVTTYAESNSDHRYTANMNGTSAATPCTTGTMAVLRSAKPNLKWYDYATIMYRAARNAAGETETASSGVSQNFINYATNSKGYRHSYISGFGIVNLDQAVSLAQNHTALPNFTKYLSTPLQASNPTTIAAGSCQDVTFDNSSGADFSIYSAELSFSGTGASYSNIALWLTASDGTLSQLKQWTEIQGNGFNYNQYFKSMAPFALNAKGLWKVKVCVRSSSALNLAGARLNFYGFNGANIIANK